MKLTVVGTGYVGLVTGTCLADVGHQVTCVDTNEAKIKALLDGECPIYEPGLETVIRRNVEHDRLQFTTDLSSAVQDTRAIYIAVGTPEGEDGSADLSYVKAVAKSIGENVQCNCLVIVKSTVPIGTCDIVEGILDETLKQRGSSFDIAVASNPEFLREGDAISDFNHPDRIVCGVVEERGSDTLREIYKPFIIDDPGKLLIMARRSSELTKYGANSMLAARISFMNELSRLCEAVGANVDDIRIGIGSDPRIGRKFLYAGPGYGGSCFPKDVQALLKSGEAHGVDLTVLQAVDKANDSQKEFACEKIKRYYGDLSGKKIAVWGLAFKPGTDDVREAPAKEVVRTVLDGGGTVVACDPNAEETFAREFGSHPNLSYEKSAEAAAQDADGVVLVTEWHEYRRPNWEALKPQLKQAVVFDFRNQYDFKRLKSLGYHYECIGRPDSKSKFS